jgi:hypothetical protein
MKDGILLAYDILLYMSSDYGANWSSINNGLSYFHIYSLAINSSCSGIDLFAGTDGGGCYSNNNGALWTPVYDGLPTDFPIYVISLAVNNGFLFAGLNNNAVWRRPLSEITGINDKHNNLPARFKQEQNYPNPFNPSTIISYQLPMINFVTLKVYDVLGREVKTLVNEREVAGNHSVTFNAGGLPSGIYFYKITAGKFTDVKKLMILK